MSVRKTRPTSAVPPRTAVVVAAPAAADVPATCGMLTALRTEVFERIDQSKLELRAEIQAVKSELRAEIAEVRAEVQELRVEVQGVKTGLVALQAEVHGLKADVARIGFLIEEQNARNKIVLDGLMAMMDRQDRIEHRMDGVEALVRSLAASRPPASSP